MKNGCQVLSYIFCQLLLCLFPVITSNGLPPLVTKHFIYGRLDKRVLVYVKILRDSPYIACMDTDIAGKEIIDPYYLWIGPDGRNLKGQAHVNLTETGKLMVKSFDKSMSGNYSCVLTYSSIRNNIRNEKEKNRIYNFLLVAYREPDYEFQINIRFNTKLCDRLTNGIFYETLISRIENLVKNLTCHLTEKYYKCHVLKVPGHTLENELFITFKVNPFAKGWENACLNITYDCEDETNKRVQEARNLIEQNIILEKSENQPEIKYVDHSLDIQRFDSCRPGFGKDDLLHSDCSGCCVACDPGTYSPNNTVECIPCSTVTIYGSSAC